MIEKKSCIAAHVSPGGRRPFGPPSVELVVRDIQSQATALDIERDEIASAHEREWAADRCFRRNMQHYCAVGGAAHPPIGYPHHVSDAAIEELFGECEVTH